MSTEERNINDDKLKRLEALNKKRELLGNKIEDAIAMHDPVKLKKLLFKHKQLGSIKTVELLYKYIGICFDYYYYPYSDDASPNNNISGPFYCHCNADANNFDKLMTKCKDNTDNTVNIILEYFGPFINKSVLKEICRIITEDKGSGGCPYAIWNTFNNILIKYNAITDTQTHNIVCKGLFKEFTDNMERNCHGFWMDNEEVSLQFDDMKAIDFGNYQCYYVKHMILHGNVKECVMTNIIQHNWMLFDCVYPTFDEFINMDIYINKNKINKKDANNLWELNNNIENGNTAIAVFKGDDNLVNTINLKDAPFKDMLWIYTGYNSDKYMCYKIIYELIVKIIFESRTKWVKNIENCEYLLEYVNNISKFCEWNIFDLSLEISTFIFGNF